MSGIILGIGLAMLLRSGSGLAPTIFEDTGVQESPEFGHEVYVYCGYSYNTKVLTELTLQIERDGHVISRNGTLVDGEPSRYRVLGSALSIRNAVRADEGVYTCRVYYRLSADRQQRMEVSANVTLKLEYYLPPDNYPECSIIPDTADINVGNSIKFICDPGESNPPVTLRVLRPDGTGSSSSTMDWTVREADHGMAEFVCVMTSDSFPTGQRTCSSSINIATDQPLPRVGWTAAGPITTVNNNKIQTTPMFRPTTNSRRFGPTNGWNPTTQSASGIETSTPRCPISVPDCTCDARNSCLAISVLIAPVAIAILAIAADVFLLWKVLQQRKVISSRGHPECAIGHDVKETYTELLQTKRTTSGDEYTDLNFPINTIDRNQETTDYENVHAGVQQSAVKENDYYDDVA